MLPPRHQRQSRRTLWIYWPKRFLGAKAKTFILLLVAVAGIALTVAAPQSVEHVRMAVFDKTAFIMSLVSRPVHAVSQTVEHVTGLSDMASDLSNLRQENVWLKQWYNRARQLEAENRSLRGLVNLADLPRARYVTARVIAESGSAFAQGIVVDAGSEHGVTTTMVVMTGDGVVGRVNAVSKHTAQIILLNDVNARVPVVIENSRHRGVLAGDNSQQPQLLYLPEDAAVSSGERVLTSGYGGVFVAGLPVGVVSETKDNIIRVRPYVDLRRLEVVQMIDFGQQDPLAVDQPTDVSE